MLKTYKKPFIEDKDIHAKLLLIFLKVPIEQVDKKMRRIAKTVNFGILYGISSFGLSEDLKLDVASAKSFYKLPKYLSWYKRIYGKRKKKKLIKMVLLLQ